MHFVSTLLMNHTAATNVFDVSISAGLRLRSVTVALYHATMKLNGRSGICSFRLVGKKHGRVEITRLQSGQHDKLEAVHKVVAYPSC